MQVDKKIPVIFQKLEEIDSRFTRVKIWLMHTGQNLNGSSFSKASVEEAIPSLANTPILGFLEQNKSGVDDYSDHRTELTRQDGEWEWKYKGSAYGVIPENNNSQFENRIGDDGVEREYLTVEGLMWNKWDDPINILNRDGGKKSQSMELHDEFEGHFDKQGVFHFTKFKFYGACLLGEDVQPAMTNSSVETDFSTEDIAFQIKQKLEEYKLLMASRQEDIESNSEGGCKVDKLELLAKYNFTNEMLVEMGIDFEAITAEELEVKLQAHSASSESEAATEEAEGATAVEVNADDVSNTVSTEMEQDVSGDVATNVQSDFALTAEQKARLIREVLREGGGYTTEEFYGEVFKYYNYYYIDYTDDMIIAESRLENYALVGFTYTMSGDVPVIDFQSKRRFKIEYVPVEGDITLSYNITSVDRMNESIDFAKITTKGEVSNEFTEISVKNNVLETEVTELREYKQTKESETRKIEIDELFAKFAQLTEEEVSEIRETAYTSNDSIEQIEVQLYALVGRKFTKFSTVPTVKKNIGVKINISTGSGITGGKPYDGLIAKYVKKDQ